MEQNLRMILGLSNTVQDLLKKQYKVTEVSVQWSRPQEISHGDLATPVALQIAKEVGQNPTEIAAEIAKELKEQAGIIKVEVAGAGYVNVWLEPVALLSLLATTKTALKPQAPRQEAPVIVEYSQPNIAKPLGAHHLLSTLIGQAIANLYSHRGFPVVKWNYLGDWGTQFGKLAVALDKWGDKPASKMTLDELLNLYVKFHEEAEGDSSLDDAGREAFKKLEAGDNELTALREDIVAVTKAALGGIYERLQVAFDTDKGEAFYQDKMEPILEAGIAAGVFKEGKEGALIVEFPEESNLPPYLVKKGDGATLYSTRDIAQMRYRMDEYSPQEILIVTDEAQKLHFEQLVATCQQLKWELPAFTNVLVGRMRFADKSMSTRKGNILRLEEVLDEAVARADKVIADHGDKVQTDDSKDLAEMMGIGAVAYGVLSQNRKQGITFDWDKMLSFEGNSAPYLQYSYARARSVLRKAEVKKPAFPKQVKSLEDKERSLVGSLRGFDSALEEARVNHMPHMLANYLYQLAQDFNAFYNDSPILDAPETIRQMRLALTDLTAEVLSTGLQLLTLRVPERM